MSQSVGPGLKASEGVAPTSRRTLIDAERLQAHQALPDCEPCTSMTALMREGHATARFEGGLG